MSQALENVLRGTLSFKSIATNTLIFVTVPSHHKTWKEASRAPGSKREHVEDHYRQKFRHKQVGTRSWFKSHVHSGPCHPQHDEYCIWRRSELFYARCSEHCAQQPILKARRSRNSTRRSHQTMFNLKVWIWMEKVSDLKHTLPFHSRLRAE